MLKQSIIELYDEYTHSGLPRRHFLERLAQLAGGTTAALALLPVLENNYAMAQVVAEQDVRLTSGTIEIPTPNGPIQAYVAKPKNTGKLPAVIVIHENRGLNPHIMDVARRAAVEGYLALAPDALSRTGGTPSDQDQARSLIRELDMGVTQQDYLSSVSFAKNHSDSSGRVGCVGFCWGGGMANQLAVHSTDLSCSVSFYGSQASAEDVPKMKIPLMLHYAGLDERINKGIPEFINALTVNAAPFTMHMYPGVNHAFHNDTNGARFDQDSANLAWQRTVAFWNHYLKI
ncbi:MAG: dienelactone hydrolase family protein [bacterium]|jgi:carboxymethylenebutenolidase